MLERFKRILNVHPDKSVPKFVNCGTLLRVNECDYIVAQIDYGLATLISLDDGNRWHEPISIESYSAISVKELFGRRMAWIKKNVTVTDLT